MMEQFSLAIASTTGYYFISKQQYRYFLSLPGLGPKLDWCEL